MCKLRLMNCRSRFPAVQTNPSNKNTTSMLLINCSDKFICAKSKLRQQSLGIARKILVYIQMTLKNAFCKNQAGFSFEIRINILLPNPVLTLP